jgi:hypothetical protein
MVSHTSTVDYRAVLSDLEAQLRAGQAHFDAWEAERASLVKAIDGVRSLLERQSQDQYSLLPPSSGGASSSGTGTVLNLPGAFRGLSIFKATLKYWQMVDRPLSSPEITDVLYKAGMAEKRSSIKNNVDSSFRRLRDLKYIEKVDEANSRYALTEAGRMASAA